MIIIFHSLYIVVKHFLKIYHTVRLIRNFQQCRLIKDTEIHRNCTRTDNLDLKFDPPLYLQRYVTVQQILINENWKSRIKKVADFGCSELNFFKYMKHLHNINEILCVDIDEDTLNENVFKVHPLTVDYLKRRPNQLKVKVLAGDVSQPDVRLRGTDAVVAIELIEHLYPDSLEALQYNIFQYMKPLLAIFTTPNYEFNILFPDTKLFRHADHKFEWTREQFQSWALNIVTRFPNYTVQFDGIGPGPIGTESIGCSTQIAVFLRHSNDVDQLSEVPKSCREIITISSLHREKHNASQGICTYYSYIKQIQAFSDKINSPSEFVYKEVDQIDYPYHVDNSTPEERILNEARYKLYSAGRTSKYYTEESDRIEYPLEELVKNEEGYFTTVAELRKLLEKQDFELEECLTNGCGRKSLCAVHYLIMENHSSSPNSDGNNSDEKTNWNITAEESDWETEYNQSVKINDDLIETNEQKPEVNKGKVEKDCSTSGKEQKLTLQFHSTLANASQSVETKEEVKRDRSSSKRQSNSFHSKPPSTSTSHSSEKTPKKGTNIKNKDVHVPSQGTSKDTESRKRKNENNLTITDNTDKKVHKKNIDIKVHDSMHSQGSNIPRSTRNSKNPVSNNSKQSTKAKVMTTSSLKRFSTKIEDSSLPSTSDIKKRKKGKKSDDDKDDIRALTECIIYNTLNNIPEVDENRDDTSNTEIPRIKMPDSINVSQTATPNVRSDTEIASFIGGDIIDQVLNRLDVTACTSNSTDNDTRKAKDLAADPINHELNHASREALFDPNSEIDMLEEFEIPPPLPPPPIVQGSTNEHHNVIIIGLSPTSEEESVVLPDIADPFPNWLLQLLGANVEEGESHDEPHFYCQGDGIGVHPSIIEVEIDEEESTSDSSSSHHEAEAGYTSSDSGVVQLPTDDVDERNLQDDVEPDMPLNRATPGSTSAADSTDEFFDSLEETLAITGRSNSQGRRN
ncbi:hypothetical protein AMK59_4750 [Oryctes borbonicus]|uniref:Small RNA 2'-O-methyltransferase n=1 Tax=Oryctes borbonicus TaxID=1629725 RepID=A0A0T6B474_9SCAR|nr:hypothetical protein AMK59_4750 [Oryctes borbonicus]